MPEVNVEVAGRNYVLGCADGEEVHLVRLADYVDQEASRLQRQMGQLAEGRLMLMAALMLADKLTDAGSGAAAAAEIQAERNALASKAEDLAERLATAEAAREVAEKRALAAEAAMSDKTDELTSFQEEQAKHYGPEREAAIAEALDLLATRIESLTGRVEAPA
ncbi:MAG: cell division protein ZapA [Paracoccaceae bacterium]